MNAYIALLITLILFSTIEVAIKMLPNTVDPVLLASMRFIVSGAVMLPFCKINLRKLSKKEIFGFVFAAAVGIAGCFIPYHKGVIQMPASSAALIFCLNPIFAVITARILLKEKFSLKIAAGLILGISGVYISIYGFSIPRFSQTYASILLLISSITFGIYTASSKWLVERYSSISVAAVVFTLGGLIMLMFVGKWDFPRDIRSVSIIAYLIFATTAIGYLCFFYALKRVSVAAGSSLFFFKPILAAFFSFLVLRETLTITYFIGMAVSLLSLFVILYGKGGKNG
ncbi:MAG: DMT family transporter [Chitinispirillales bacterium]|jgi:drug/metabolite transporter (DMT)-like permease|nr:DMT family transporter [Chitinispirillales bacterium]